MRDGLVAHEEAVADLDRDRELLWGVIIVRIVLHRFDL